MLTLSGRVIPIRDERGPMPGTAVPEGRRVFSLTTRADIPRVLRGAKALLVKKPLGIEPPLGFQRYFFLDETLIPRGFAAPATVLPKHFEYLDDDDVVAASADHLRSLFRAKSEHNSLLVTEQCNNYCLMCSQPPKRADDGWLLDELFEALRLVPRTARSIGLTGGEPTLFGDRFVALLRHAKHWLPSTALHVLSNGRAFADPKFARAYADVEHPDLMVGIPVYSSDPARHDYVVQARGAFDETIRGILNLKRLGQRVELRVVIHKQTHEGLPDLADFIARNLLFVDQVALMGLEMTGFTLANLPALWIDPAEYQPQLQRAVSILRAAGVRALIYNHQLCLVDPRLHDVYVKSISDWKNEYAPECGPCVRRHECGGFFSSGLQHGYSQSLKPFLS